MADVVVEPAVPEEEEPAPPPAASVQLNLSETFGAQLQSNNEQNTFEGNGSFVVHNVQQKYTVKFDTSLTLSKDNRQQFSIAYKLAANNRNEALEYVRIRFAQQQQGNISIDDWCSHLHYVANDQECEYEFLSSTDVVDDNGRMLSADVLLPSMEVEIEIDWERPDVVAVDNECMLVNDSFVRSQFNDLESPAEDKPCAAARMLLHSCDGVTFYLLYDTIKHASPVLKAHFEEIMSNNKPKEPFTVHGEQGGYACVLRAMFKYVYMGYIDEDEQDNIINNHIHHLIAAADYLAIDSVIDACKCLLRERLVRTNVQNDYGLLLRWFEMTAKYSKFTDVFGIICELLVVHIKVAGENRKRFIQTLHQNGRYFDAQALMDALLPVTS